MLQDLLNNVKSFIGNAGNAIQNDVVRPMGNGAGFAGNVIQGLPQAFSDYTNQLVNNQRTILPYANTSQDTNLLQTLSKKVANFGSGVINNVATEGIIKPTYDLAGGIAANALNQPINHDTFKSGAFRLGADIAGGGVNAQNTLADIGQTAMPILNAWGGGNAEKLLQEGTGQIGLKQLAINGAKQNAGVGALFGLAGGAEQGREQTLPQQLLNMGIGGAGGAVAGAALGAATPYVGDQFSKTVGDATKFLSKIKDGSISEPKIIPSGALISSGGDHPQMQNPNAFNPQSLLFKGMQTLEGKGAGLSIKDVSGGKPSDPVAQVKSFIPQNLTKNEAKGVAKNLGLQGNPAEIPTGEKPMGITETVQGSNQTTPELQKMDLGSYDVKHNADTLAAAQERIAKDPNAAYAYALNNHNAEANTAAILIAKQYEANGQSDLAAELMMHKAQQALEAGQGNQIYAMWDKLSPETIAQTAAKTIAKYNETAKEKIPGLTAEQYQHFVDGAKAIQGMADERLKGMATQKLLREIGGLIPSSTGSQVFGLWRAGLLTGFRTPGKIIASHAISNTAEAAKNIPASIVDMASSLLTGKRGMTATLKGNLKGGWQEVLDGVDNLVHGYNAPNSGGMAHDFTMHTNYGNTWYGKVAQKYVDGIGRLHGSMYKPFYGAAHLNSLFDQAMTEASNQGLKGTEAEKFIANFVEKPPVAAAERAIKEAEYVTFQNKTKLGQVFGGIQQKGGGVGKAVIPFSQIPSAIIMRTFDYSPVGLAKTIFENVGKGKFDQRDFSQGVGRAITGTGIAALGAMLYNQGLMTLSYPTTKAEQSVWRAEGKVENAIKIGGKWRQLSSLGPSGDLLAMGGETLAGTQNGGGALGAMAQGTAGLGNIVANTPYFTSAGNLMSAVKDPSGKAPDAVKSFGGSVIPTGISNIAAATDPLARQTNNIQDVLMSKVPGLREMLNPQYDTFGQNIPRAQGPIGSLIDPMYSSTDRSTPTTQEIERLIQGGNSVSFDPLTKNQTIYGQKVTLNPDQLTKAMQQLGPQVKAAVESVMQSPMYQNLDDTQKAAILNTAITGAKDNKFQLNQILQGQTLNTPGKKGVSQPGQTTLQNAPLASQASSETPAKFPSKYQIQMAKDQLANSDQNFMQVDNYVVRKAADGTVSAESIDKYQSSLNEASLTDDKSFGDYGSWVQTAQQQMQLYQNQMKDPNTDQLDKIQIQNKMNTLEKEYRTYAIKGFPGSGSSGRGKKATAAKVKDTKLSMKAPKLTIKEAKAKTIALPKQKSLYLPVEKSTPKKIQAKSYAIKLK